MFLIKRNFPNLPALWNTGLRQELGRVFDGLLDRPWGWEPAFPALNLRDAGDALVLESEVPGLPLADLEILEQGDELTIKGKREWPAEDNARYLRRERVAGEFSRTLTLPVEIEADHVEATLKDGVLTVRLPKAEAAKPRRIAVKNA